MKPSRSLVITTIASPNRVLRTYAAQCRDHGIDLIIIGDRKSPDNFALPGSDYWNIERQKGSGYISAAHIPENQYSRKNIGYLAAIEKGHGIILETDDDNLPYDSFWYLHENEIRGRLVSHRGWINIYSLFSDETIWPRGFPLERLEDQGGYEPGPEEMHVCPIRQGLADENPDVDAVYRLTRKLPISFKGDMVYVLGRGSWCPFNSQNTAWFGEAFPLLYLPSLCSFRMTDIWRSFVAQRIAWEYGWKIAFYSPTVYQERNEHDLLKDFRQEVPGYLNNTAIGRALEDLVLSGRKDDIYGNLQRCYEKLVDMRLVGEEEITILDSWIEDLQRIA
jgi:hypothetical protein